MLQSLQLGLCMQEDLLTGSALSPIHSDADMEEGVASAALNIVIYLHVMI